MEDVPLPVKVNVNEPKNKASLYAALSIDKAKNSDDVIAPKVKLVFSSPITKSCHWPKIVLVGDKPLTALL